MKRAEMDTESAVLKVALDRSLLRAGKAFLANQVLSWYYNDHPVYLSAFKLEPGLGIGITAARIDALSLV